MTLRTILPLLPALLLLATSALAKPVCSRAKVVRAVACVCYTSALTRSGGAASSDATRSAVVVTSACVAAFGDNLARLHPLCARRSARPRPALSDAVVARLEDFAERCDGKLPAPVATAIRAIRSAGVPHVVRQDSTPAPSNPTIVVLEMLRRQERKEDVRVAKLNKFNALRGRERD